MDEAGADDTTNPLVSLAIFRAILETLAAEYDQELTGQEWTGNKQQRQRDTQKVAQQAVYSLVMQTMAPQLALPFRKSLIALTEISEGREVDWLAPERQSKPKLGTLITKTRIKIVAVMDFLNAATKMGVKPAIRFIMNELGPDRITLLTGHGAKARNNPVDAIYEWRRDACKPGLKRTYTDIREWLGRQGLDRTPTELAADLLRLIANDLD